MARQVLISQEVTAGCGAPRGGKKVLDYRPITTPLGVVVPSQNGSIYRFGVFELDLRAAELRKNGVKLRLQDQPCQVLVKLLERPGELISREELRTALWHGDTFVDFETGLNTAIKRLRETLGDSAESPIFIETLPRRGYRFIAPVEVSASREREARGPGLPHETPNEKKRGKLRWIAATVGALLLLGVANWFREPRPPTVANAVRISNDRKAKSPLNPFVTDGVHLYFVEGMPWTTGSGIAQMSANGGETTWIATPLPEVLAIYNISPDRSELLVGNGAAVGPEMATELWIQPLPAGAPHRVGNIRASSATWTPDGTRIVYAYGPTILMANKDGSEPLPLATLSGIARALRFSPDGRRIRFYLVPPKADANSIWEMDADGKNTHPLFPDWKESPYQCCGNWSPDGDYYYFQGGRGSMQAIWVLPEHRPFLHRAASSPSRLIAGPLRFGASVPSSDGKKLFVVGDEPRVELVRYDQKAGRFDSYLGGPSAGPVDFSSDGKWIAYIAYPEMTLWRCRMDGSEKMQLTFPPMRAYEPRWSPDGTKIAFLDVQIGSPWKIRVLSPSGGSPELMVQDNNGEGDPTWMPDGKTIVFGKSDAYGKGTIYRLDLNSRKLSLVPDSVGLFSPRVSPEGRYISALADGQKKLMLFDTTTNQWSTLLEGEAVAYNEWSHDGRYVYLRQNSGGSAELARVRIKDRVLEHVLSLKDFPQLTDIFAVWVGLTPDDAPLLMRIAACRRFTRWSYSCTERFVHRTSMTDAAPAVAGSPSLSRILGLRR